MNSFMSLCRVNAYIRNGWDKRLTLIAHIGLLRKTRITSTNKRLEGHNESVFHTTANVNFHKCTNYQLLCDENG